MKIFSEKQYYGVSVSPGFGEGKAYVMCPFPGEYRAAASLAPADETERFYQARECYCRQVGQQVRQLEGSVSHEAVQILLLQQALAWDKGAELQICDLLEQGYCVESAVDQVWTGLGDSVPERYADFEDVRRGLLHALAGVQTYSFLKAIPEKTVLITEDLSPAMVAHLNPKRISAVLCQSGGSHAHGAILIRAMEIPCIMQLPEILKVPAGTDILCDASAGQVIAAPRRDSRICFYKAWQRQCVNPYPSASDAEENLQTADGSPIQIFCNVSSAEEVQAGVLQGAVPNFCLRQVLRMKIYRFGSIKKRRLISLQGSRSVSAHWIQAGIRRRISTQGSGESDIVLPTVNSLKSNCALFCALRQSITQSDCFCLW